MHNISTLATFYTCLRMPVTLEVLMQFLLVHWLHCTSRIATSVTAGVLMFARTDVRHCR